jgi:hypothetical protein
VRATLAAGFVIFTALGAVAAVQEPTPGTPGITVEGGVGFINPGSPVLPESEFTSRPIPRLPDGTVDLTGPWIGGGAIQDLEANGGFKPGELPLLPWARELRDRRRPQDEPYTACLPMGPLRSNPYPWKFAAAYTSRGLTHMYLLHELGDAGNHRVIYMDGRKHRVDAVPTWTGHSIGRFEGDTLVVDAAGFNGKWWWDRRGTPHTEQLHVIERYTRMNYGQIRNDATVDDPGAFSRPFNVTFTARLLRPNPETGVGDLLEFICNEDNQYGQAAQFRPGTGAGNR